MLIGDKTVIHILSQEPMQELKNKWTTHLPRYCVESLAYRDVALISMTNPGSQLPCLDYWKQNNILTLQFHDVVSPVPAARGPTKEHAKLIVDFIQANFDKPIITHCEAGISRSGACSTFLRRIGWEYINPKVSPWKLYETILRPNELLLEHLMKEAVKRKLI